MDAIEVQQTRLMADREFRNAIGKIRSFARNAQEADTVEDALCIYAFLAVQHKQSSSTRTPKELWEECWARDTGKSWKALTEFPDRVRKISTEVRGVSGSAFFDPGRAIRGELASWTDCSYRVFSGKDKDFIDFAKRQFTLLPATLERYADWLEVQVKGISALMKHYYRRTPRKHSGFIHFVSNEVKRITGRFYDRHVAELLNAADRVVNPSHREKDDRFDEQMIALLRSRQKKKSSKR